jgi:cytochrome d ubiquinol oxidase subunit II
MWVEGVAFFLGTSLLLYCLLAGADFGGGILEIFRGSSLREEQRELIAHAIGPVWEANHMWLILAVVILFNGFPKAYAELSTTLHIPLTLMLVGIILRGCAFTFRKYDAYQDTTHEAYSGIFMASSLLTPLMLGVIAGASFRGSTPHPGASFHAVYIAPWCNAFSFAIGIFTGAIFAFLAAVYLVGEAPDPALRAIFTRRARAANVAVVLVGALVFLIAESEGLGLLSAFLKHAPSLLCMTAATVLLLPLWRSLNHGRTSLARVFAAVQVTLVLLGWFGLRLPALFGSLTIYEAAAPEPVLCALLGALVVGSALIFPALAYLLWVFKLSGAPAQR